MHRAKNKISGDNKTVILKIYGEWYEHHNEKFLLYNGKELLLEWLRNDYISFEDAIKAAWYEVLEELEDTSCYVFGCKSLIPLVSSE